MMKPERIPERKVETSQEPVREKKKELTTEEKRERAKKGGVLALTAVALFALSQLIFPPAKVDALTQLEVHQIIEGYAQLGQIALPAVNIKKKREAAIAIKSMALNHAAEQSLIESLNRDETELRWIELFDTHAEDGDVIRVSTGGYSRVIGILNAPVRFAIPISGPQTVEIEAVTDGGGGVTLGVTTPSGPYPLPPLAVGQLIEVEVR